MAIAKKTIDVSAYQGNIDWAKVKADGIDYVILRCGTGYPKNHPDDKFVYNVTECNRLGIPVGVYWFSYASNVAEATAEANYVLALIKPYRIDLPVVYDFEYDSVKKANAKGIQVTKALATSLAKAFLSTIQNNKYYAMIYANGDYLNNYFDSSITKAYDLWYAAWPKSAVNWQTDKPSRSCGIWQYGTSTVNGIAGGVDTNVAYRDYVTIIKNAGLNNLPVDNPATPAPSEQEILQVKYTTARNYLKTVNADQVLARIVSVIYAATKKPPTQAGDAFNTSVNYIAQSSGGVDLIIDLATYIKSIKN